MFAAHGCGRGAMSSHCLAKKMPSRRRHAWFRRGDAALPSVAASVMSPSARATPFALSVVSPRFAGAMAMVLRGSSRVRYLEDRFRLLPRHDD